MFSPEYRIQYYTKNIINKIVALSSDRDIKHDSIFVTNINELKLFRKDPNKTKIFADFFFI
jgi:hypothetical protein